MTAFYVFAQCANHLHGDCPEFVHLTEEQIAAEVCGGAACRCRCHTGERYYSVCSRHVMIDPNCNACQAGSWYKELD